MEGKQKEKPVIKNLVKPTININNNNNNNLLAKDLEPSGNERGDLGKS